MVAEATDDGILIRPAVTLPSACTPSRRRLPFYSTTLSIAKTTPMLAIPSLKWVLIPIRFHTSRQRRSTHGPCLSGRQRPVLAAYRPESSLTRLWDLPRCELITSGYASEEARRNLGSATHRDQLTQLLGRLEVVAEAPISEWDEAWRLPKKDCPILAAAIRTSATHLLTGDLKHFKHLMGTVVEGVRILRPAVYLSTFAR